jgi:hypothetical protein
LQNFVSGVPHAIFSKNTRILTVIFIGYRQLDNAFFFYLPTTAYTTTPFVHQTFYLYNNYLILFTLPKEKKKTGRYYALNEILYSILLMEASIEPEKIVINNLHSIY